LAQTARLGAAGREETSFHDMSAKPTKPNRRHLVVASFLFAAAAALWFGQDTVTAVFAALSSKSASESGGKAGAPAVPVVVERVGSGANDVTIEAIATARARRFVTLFPEAAGEVVEIAVRAGDRVRAGGVILKLDSRAAELAVKLAKVRVREAERQLERSRHLLRSQVNPQAKVEDARTVLERTGLELQQAEEALTKRTLRAPFDGVVGIAKIETGDRVTTTSEAITIDDRSELVVEIEVPEQFFSRLAAGQQVTAETTARAGERFEGTVEKIDSRIDPVSRTVMVRAALPNVEDRLRPGMSFAIQLKIPGKTYPAIPELALQWRKGQSFVWQVTGKTVRRVNVRTVRRRNATILVDGPIAEGDLVVTEGVQRLRPGRAVRYADPAAVPGS